MPLLRNCTREQLTKYQVPYSRAQNIQEVLGKNGPSLPYFDVFRKYDPPHHSSLHWHVNAMIEVATGSQCDMLYGGDVTDM